MKFLQVILTIAVFFETFGLHGQSMDQTDIISETEAKAFNSTSVIFSNCGISFYFKALYLHTILILLKNHSCL